MRRHYLSLNFVFLRLQRFLFPLSYSIILVFNCLGVNDSPKRGVLREACLGKAPGDLRGDENKILILPRGFCCPQKRENGRLACTVSQILSAKLPVSILALVLMSILFVPLTIASPLLLQFFLSPSFPFLFTSVSPFPHRSNFIFKNNLNT